MQYVVSLLCLAWLATTEAVWYGQPEQIHLAYGGEPGSMMVTWVQQEWNTSYIDYGTGNKFERRMPSDALKFTDGGSQQQKMYIHRALLTGLQTDTVYIYRVGHNMGWSPIFFFTPLSAHEPAGYRICAYGDLGNESPMALGMITEAAQRGDFDMVLHTGDMAYDLADKDAKNGDQWFRQIESIAGYMPYMVAAGNHERTYNFSNYVARYSMPNWQTQGNHFYSFDLGPVHYLAFNTEFYYYSDLGYDQIYTQYNFIVNDLKAANQNRASVPWIVTYAHRPMYCGNDNDKDCGTEKDKIRIGFSDSGNSYPGLEDAFYEAGVDLLLWGHEHSYERMWPVYNRTVYKGSSAPYTDPPAPVHIVTGSAGNPHGQDGFIAALPPWSAFHSTDYGYSLMTVYNSTHLKFEQNSVNMGGSLIDTIWIVKNAHGPYSQMMQTNADMVEKERQGLYVPKPVSY